MVLYDTLGDQSTLIRRQSLAFLLDLEHRSELQDMDIRLHERFDFL